MLTQIVVLELRAINNYVPLVTAVPLTKKAQNNDQTFLFIIWDFMNIYPLFTRLQETNEALTLYTNNLHEKLNETV